MEREIRKEVDSRVHSVNVETDWYTPSGNRRSAPMYVAQVANAYLGKRRELKAKTAWEIESKIKECLEKWDEQEIKKRVVEAKKDAKEQAQAGETSIRCGYYDNTQTNKLYF